MAEASAPPNAPPNDDQENMRIAHVLLKLPPFWTADPLVWFAQIESQFATRGITSQRTKYEYVVASLSQDIAMEVRDILISPPAVQPFSTLKDKLLLRTTVSEQRRLQTLLTTVELGDRTPSQLLREMQRLLGESVQQIDQALIRELFLQRLPPSIRMIMASTGPDISLDAQATLADKMMEVSPALHQVHSVEQGQRRSERPEQQPEQSLKSDIRDLKWQMEELTHKVDQLMTARSRPESRSLNPAPRPRQRSQSGNRPEGTRYPFRNDTCYYHFKFGDQATRCEGPCKMSAGNDQARH